MAGGTWTRAVLWPTGPPQPHRAPRRCCACRHIAALPCDALRTHCSRSLAPLRMVCGSSRTARLAHISLTARRPLQERTNALRWPLRVISSLSPHDLLTISALSPHYLLTISAQVTRFSASRNVAQSRVSIARPLAQAASRWAFPSRRPSFTPVSLRASIAIRARRCRDGVSICPPAN